MTSKLTWGFMYKNEFFQNEDPVEIKGHLQGCPNKKYHGIGYLNIGNSESSWIGIKKNPGKVSFSQIVPIQINSITILKHTEVDA